ncbi:hypothetical protein CYMTET_9083, partial [Cymbomonas tetramitiformis]
MVFVHGSAIHVHLLQTIRAVFFEFGIHRRRTVDHHVAGDDLSVRASAIFCLDLGNHRPARDANKVRAGVSAHRCSQPAHVGVVLLQMLELEYAAERSIRNVFVVKVGFESARDIGGVNLGIAAGCEARRSHSPRRSHWRAVVDAAAAGSEAGAKAEAETEAEAKAEAETEGEVMAKAEAETVAEAETEAEVMAKAEAETVAEAETEAEVMAKAEAETKAEAVTVADAEAKAKAEAKAEAETEAEVMAKAEAETKAEAVTVAEAEAKAEAEARVEARAEVKVAVVDSTNDAE